MQRDLLAAGRGECQGEDQWPTTLQHTGAIDAEQRRLVIVVDRGTSLRIGQGSPGRRAEIDDKLFIFLIAVIANERNRDIHRGLAGRDGGRLS